MAGKKGKNTKASQKNLVAPEQNLDYIQYSIECDGADHALRADVKISRVLYGFDTVQQREKTRNPLQNMYSIDEDRFLLFVDVANEELGSADEDGEKSAVEASTAKRGAKNTDKDGNQKQSIREQRAKDLQKRYAAKHQEQPDVFRKEFITGQQLLNRTQDLKMSGLRHQILQFDVMNQVQRMKQRRIPGASSSDHLDDASADGDTAQSRRRASRAGSVITQAMQDKMRQECDVRITVTGSSFDPVQFYSQESKLTAASSFLQRVLPDMQKHLASGFKELGLSELDEAFGLDGPQALHGALQPDTIRKFLDFAENFGILDKCEEVKKKFAQIEDDSQSLISRHISQLEAQRDGLIQKMKSELESDRADVIENLERIRDDNLQRIRLLYDTHIHNVSSQIDVLMEQRAQELTKYYEREVQQTRILFDQQHAERKRLAQEELQKIRNEVDRLFPPDNIMPTFVLSEVLKAEEARAACFDIICKDFEHYCKHPAFESSLITPSTLKAITTRLTPEQLIAADRHNVQVTFPRTYIEREISNRKSIVADEYRYMNTSQLIELQDKELVFPDVLSAELNRRRSYIPSVSLDPQRCSKYISLDETQLTARVNTPGRYALIHATSARGFDGWGKWYYEVRITELDTSYGSSMCLGFDIERKPGSEAFQQSSSNSLYIGWQSDGILQYCGKTEFIDQKYVPGDVIGITIDQDKKCIMFYKNGERVVLWKRIRNGKTNEIMHVDIEDPWYRLFPAAVLYSCRAHAPCSASFRFQTPFESFKGGEPPQFQFPYGDDKKQRPSDDATALATQTRPKSAMLSSSNRNKINET